MLLVLLALSPARVAAGDTACGSSEWSGLDADTTLTLCSTGFEGLGAEGASFDGWATFTTTAPGELYVSCTGDGESSRSALAAGTYTDEPGGSVALLADGYRDCALAWYTTGAGDFTLDGASLTWTDLEPMPVATDPPSVVVLSEEDRSRLDGISTSMGLIGAVLTFLMTAALVVAGLRR